MWVEFVVGFRLALRVFLRVLRFSSLHKNQHYKFQFDQDRGPAWKPAKADVASSLNSYRFPFHASRAHQSSIVHFSELRNTTLWTYWRGCPLLCEIICGTLFTRSLSTTRIQRQCWALINFVLKEACGFIADMSIQMILGESTALIAAVGGAIQLYSFMYNNNSLSFSDIYLIADFCLFAFQSPLAVILFSILVLATNIFKHRCGEFGRRDGESTWFCFNFRDNVLLYPLFFRCCKRQGDIGNYNASFWLHWTLL